MCVLFYLQALSLPVAHAPGSTPLDGAMLPIPAPVANAGPVVTGPMNLTPEVAGSNLAEPTLPAFVADAAVILAPAVRTAVDGAQGCCCFCF